MNEITFILVKTYNTYRCNQRFYESSLPLIKSAGMAKGMHLKDALIKEREYLKEDFKHLIHDDIQGVTLVCVSDAHTHTERLVFAGLKVGDEYSRLGLQIDGKHTYISNGGDENSVYDDEVYLRHLSKLSSCKYKGLKDEKINHKL